MSKLESLLQELCPDGVEYKKLGDIATISRGGNFQKKDYTETGVPCIHYGQIYTLYDMFVEKTVSYISEETAKRQKFAEKNDVVMAVTSENIEDVCKCIAWLGNEPAAISGHSAIIHHAQNPRYMTYYLNSSHFFKQKVKLAHGTKVVEVTPSKLTDIVIPVPPLPVQEEIVRILDKFEQIRRELEHELEKRKQQFEYYREQLIENCNTGEKGILLDMLCQTITDGPHETPKLFDQGVPFISAEAIADSKIDFSRKRGYISEAYNELCCKKYRPQKDDVFLVKSGSTTGKVAYVESDLIFNIWSPIAAMRVNSKSSSRYLFHLLQTKKIQTQIKMRSSVGSQPNLGMRALEKFEVNIPSFEEQGNIANILDKFDTICNDTSIGLPAEIAARQTQYEYYRDKLLTFKARA